MCCNIAFFLLQYSRKFLLYICVTSDCPKCFYSITQELLICTSKFLRFSFHMPFEYLWQKPKAFSVILRTTTKKCFLLFIFVFYLLNNCICKPVFDLDDFHCWWNRRKVMSQAQWKSVHTSVWILDKLCKIFTIISYVYNVS